MKLIIAVLLIAAAAQALDDQSEWNDYKVSYNKNYATAEEEEFRFQIFVENKKKINEHNAKYEKGEVSYKLGLNQFSDWTEAEYKKILGLKPRTNNDIQKIWAEWKAKYNKEYATPEEEEYRFNIFAEYKKEVDRVNAKYANGEINFTLHLGVYSDLTEDEKIRLESFNPHLRSARRYTFAPPPY